MFSPDNVTPPLSLVSDSPNYVFLERDLTDPALTTYLKRNYNVKTPLTFDGLNVHGYAVMSKEFRYLVATDGERDLWVITMGVKYVPR